MVCVRVRVCLCVRVLAAVYDVRSRREVGVEEQLALEVKDSRLVVVDEPAAAVPFFPTQCLSALRACDRPCRPALPTDPRTELSGGEGAHSWSGTKPRCLEKGRGKEQKPASPMGQPGW